MTVTENRFPGMKRTQIYHLLLISGFCSVVLGSSEFHLINRSESYQDAKTYCRGMHTDLATVRNVTDMDTLITLASTTTARAWIGLENGSVWSWHWSLPDQTLDFLNWKAGEPQNVDQDACAAMDGRGEWLESDCRLLRRFVCQGTGNSSGPIYVALAKSWRAAQDHCRGLSSDLVSIQSAEENEAVQTVSLSQQVWIGLFKDPWKWSDGSNSSFRFWKPNQPNNFRVQDCVAAIFISSGKWNDRKCSDRRRFFCSGARKLSTQEPLTPSPLPANVTNLPDVTSEEIIITLHLNVATSKTTNVPTIEATTTNKLSTPYATEFMLSTLSTKLNNATTEMSTLTVTRLPHMTTVQVDSASALTTEMSTLTVTRLPHMTTVQVDSASALTTPVGTSVQTTTQALTPKPTENSQHLPQENLILIRENKTWIEAMIYCREHYIDLVHITSRDIQGKVAEKAKNATSPHVWLGLRYTCNLNFWSWISSTTSCYQNWAPGQGPDGTYECGVTGAIDATGGQQWVGLRETDKLNFICSVCAG